MYHIIAVWCCVFQEVRISCSCSGYVSSWWYLTSPLDGGYIQCTFQLTGPQKSILDSADRWSACVCIPSVQSVRTPELKERSSELCQRLWRLWAQFCATVELWGAFMPFCGLLCKHSLVVKLSSLISVDVTRNGVSLDESWQNSETNSCGQVHHNWPHCDEYQWRVIVKAKTLQTFELGNNWSTKKILQTWAIFLRSVKLLGDLPKVWKPTRSCISA